MYIANSKARKLAVCGLLTAIAVVLGGMLKIPVTLFGAYSLKLSLGPVPVIIAALLYGPVYGAICGGLHDMLGAIMFPVGAFNPAFSVVAALAGMIPALFFMRGGRFSVPRLAVAITTSQLACSVLLNTLLLMAFYGMPFTLIIPRALSQLVLIPAYTLSCTVLMKLIGKSGVAVE